MVHLTGLDGQNELRRIESGGDGGRVNNVDLHANMVSEMRMCKMQFKVQGSMILKSHV